MGWASSALWGVPGLPKGSKFLAGTVLDLPPTTMDPINWGLFNCLHTARTALGGKRGHYAAPQPARLHARWEKLAGAAGSGAVGFCRGIPASPYWERWEC